MRLAAADIERGESHIRSLRRHYPNVGLSFFVGKDEREDKSYSLRDDMPQNIYIAFISVFRDLGIHMEESDELENTRSNLVVSPSGSTLIVPRSESNRFKVWMCAASLGYMIITQEGEYKWFIVSRYDNHCEASIVDYGLHEDADKIAAKLLSGSDVSIYLKLSMAKTVIRTFAHMPMSNRMIDSMKRLHRYTYAKYPAINNLIKAMPGAHVFWLMVKSIYRDVSSCRGEKLTHQVYHRTS